VACLPAEIDTSYGTVWLMFSALPKRFDVAVEETQQDCDFPPLEVIMSL
jgi:hypothetical protein